MKTRTSFVANSSSSSFIIGCSKIPKNYCEAGTIWFGDQVDYVAPAVLKGMFEGMKGIKFDVDKFRTIALKTKHFNKIRIKGTEAEIIRELFNEFWYNEKYGRSDFFYSNRPTAYEKFKEEETAKLAVKLKCDVNKVPWDKRWKIEEKYFSKSEVRQRFIDVIENFIEDFKNCDVLMMGEFHDDSTLGCEIEHNGPWEKFAAYRRFSHH